MSNGDGSADVVQIPKDHGKDPADAPNLKALLNQSEKSSKSFISRGSISPPSTNAFGVMAAAGLLHQDRLAAVAATYNRSPWP